MKRVWNLFSSVWLTIVLSALICAVAVWGSLLSMKYPRFYRALDKEILFPWLYHNGGEYPSLTLWIYVLIALTAVFTANTVICTADKVLQILKNKKPWRALFPHIVHIGFLIALLGHFAGSVWGFRSEGNMVFKGAPAPVPYVDGLFVRFDDMEMKASDTGDLESLKTRVTLLRDGKEVRSGSIEINGPLIYNGIAFYHSDQGQAPEGLILDIGGEEASLDFDGGSFSSADGKTYSLGRLLPDLAFDGEGKAYSRSNDFRNPHIEVISGGRSAYLGLNAPGMSTTLEGRKITLLNYKLTPYVILSINKDPGIWLIILGSAVLVTGMVLLLFFRGERGELIRQRG